MRDKELVSIIVPVYNVDYFLNKCIDSILNQSYREIELVLVNDGSTDNSGKICDMYQKKDNRVRVIHQKNQGVSAARNQGLSVASGNYIQFVDADDYIDGNMTEILVNEIIESLDVVICGYRTIYTDENNEVDSIDSEVFEEFNISKETFLEKFNIYFEELYINFTVNKLYSSDIIKKNNIWFDEKVGWGEDLIFNLDYFDNCNNITIIKDILYNYVKDNEFSITSTFNESRYENQQKMHNKLRIFLKKNNSYSGKNKDTVETRYIESIISSMNNWFHESANYSDSEIKNKMNEVVSNDIIYQNRLYFQKLGIQSKIIGLLINKKKVNLLIYYFKFVNWMKIKINPVYEILYQFNKYIQKTNK